MNRPSVLVTGASGTIGQRLVKKLCDKGTREVRALVRNDEKAKTVQSSGAAPVLGSFEDTHALSQAMTGVDTVVLITPANSDAVAQTRNVINAAMTAGTRRIIRISALKAEAEGPTANTRLHAQSEQDIKESSLTYTILRPNFFMQNLLFAAQTLIQENAFYFGMGEGRMGMVDTRDVSDCAAAVAKSAAYDGETMELTGPESINFGDVSAAMTTILERPVNYVAVPPQAVFETIQASGWGDWMAAVMRDYASAYRRNWGDFTTGSVRRITGRPARSVESFLKEVLKPAIEGQGPVAHAS